MLQADLVEEETQAALLKVLAHPFRVRIVEELSDQEECVCHLSTLFDRPQPFVSQHLATLKEAGLVLDRRAGQRIFYRTADSRIVEILKMARALAGVPERARKPRVPVPGCPCPKCDPTAQ